jgi:ABC-type multidrug transport system fused ATPase/permease subunit
MATLADSLTPEQVTLTRLEEQLVWYDKKSAVNQSRYRSLRILTIVFAALIPVLTTAPEIPQGSHIAAGLGVLIAIIESVQQLNRYQTNWTSYRGTAEALKHEKFLYLAKAGHYLNDPNPQTTLAERVETLLSQENVAWISGTSKPDAASGAKTQ